MNRGSSGALFVGAGRAYGLAMVPLFRFALPVIAGLALGAATQPAHLAGTAPDLTRLTERHRHDLRCAAAFAVVAAGQARGDAATLALPPLGIRGRSYLGLVGERVAAETGLSGETVRDLLADAAQRLGPQGAPIAAGQCLGELDAAVPPRPAPDTVDCLAILGTYAEAIDARDPGSALAATLHGEAAALMPPPHDPATDRAIDRAKARVREALTGGPASVDADDYAACRRLAHHG